MGEPYEMCKRYAAGKLTRDELVDALTDFQYARVTHTESILDDAIIPEGAFFDVEQALSSGLIDDNLFDEVVERRGEAFLLADRESKQEERKRKKGYKNG